MTDNFAEIRTRITAEAVARYAGLQITNHRTACPFHGGEHPNLSFYSGGFRCFVCGEGGSSLDFWAKLYGTTVLNAARDISTAFHLCIDFDQQRRRLATPTKRIADVQAWEDALLVACENWVLRRYRELLTGPGSLYALAGNLRSGYLADLRTGTTTQRKQVRQAEQRLRRQGREFAVLREIIYDTASDDAERRAARLFVAEREAVRAEIAQRRREGKLTSATWQDHETWREEMAL